jgi:hypothetical protein
LTAIGQIAGWVADYDRQGWHRTGSPADTRCAHWLAASARQAGATAELTPFRFLRLVHRGSSLRIGSFSVPGVPLFDAVLPPPGGVGGPLGRLGSGAAIGVADSRAGAAHAASEEVARARLDGDHGALVVIGPGGSGGLALLNAPEAERPFGPPVIQVSSQHAARIHRAADAGRAGLLRIDAERRASVAFNVEARLGDAQGQAPGVVVLTPRSGWWHCAAERGGGIGCWLAAIAAAAGGDPRPARPALFVATSGHELGHLGLRHYLDSRSIPGDPVWVHLGANVGASGGELRVAASGPQLLSLALAALRAVASAPPAQPSAVPAGEATELRDRGQRYVSFVGSNMKFHQRSDRYPENVDLRALSAVCSAVTRLVGELTR